MAAAIAAAAMFTVSAQCAPGKPDPTTAAKPAAAAEPAPPAKKGVFGKVKSALRIGRKDAVPEPEVKPAPKPPVSAKAKPSASVVPKEKTAPAAPLAADKPEPPKKGFIRNLFAKEEKPGTESEPKLATVKTVKPAPVKEVKSVKPDEALADNDGESKKKRGLFGFLRRDRVAGANGNANGAAVPDDNKMERPDDWQERSVVNDDEIALYEFGPSQSRPDARLSRGTVVKVKRVERGWALVEVDSGKTGYMDATSLRSAAKEDFRDPVIPAMAAINPENWAPMAPPPDLPEQPGPTGSDAALLLLPPLELEPKPNP